MALKTAIFSTTLIAALLLLTLTKTTAFPDYSHHHHPNKTNQIKKLITRDAISLTIDEGYEIRRFIASLPSLRSLRATLGEDEDKAEALLYDCQQRLDAHLHGISSTLRRLLRESYRKTPHLLLADTQALQEAVNGAVGLGSGEACSTVDHKFVSSLLQRRLQDFSQTINDVVHLVNPVVPPKSMLAESGQGQSQGHAKTQP